MEHAEEPTPNRLAVRHANRERKRKQRARDKARSDRAVQAYFNRLQAAKVNADGLAWQQKRNLCTLGEIAPGVDAATIDEALEVAREFARALVISDVQNGESLQELRTPRLRSVGELRQVRRSRRRWWEGQPSRAGKTGGVTPALPVFQRGSIVGWVRPGGALRGSG